MSNTARFISHVLDMEGFYALLDDVRREQGLSWAQVSREVGIDGSLFTMMKQGKRDSISVHTFLSLVVWLDEDVELDLITKKNPAYRWLTDEVET